MRAGTSDPAAWSARLDELLPPAAARFTDLARAAVATPAARAGDDGWCAEEVIRHVLTHFQRNLWDDRVFPDPATGDAINQQSIEETLSIPLVEVPDLIDFHAETLYRRVWPTIPLDASLPFHFGLRVSPVARRANSMRELLLHGWDLAQALGAEWALPDADVAATAPSGEVLACLLRGPYEPATFAIALGDDVTCWYHLDEDGLSFEARLDSDPPADAARPPADAWALSVMSGRAPIPDEGLPLARSLGLA